MRRRHMENSQPEHQADAAPTPFVAGRVSTAPAAARGTVMRATRPPAPMPEWLIKANVFYLDVMDALPYSLVQYCMPSVPAEKMQLVNDLKVGRVVSFTDSNPAHMDLLKRLWEAHHRIVFASEPLRHFNVAEHRSHEDWKSMGFQGLDPATDFRGAGCFALEQLVYLAEKHPDLWSRFLTPDFLLGAAGINVSMRLMSLLEWSSGVNVVDMQHRGIIYSRRRAQCRLVDYSLGTDGAAAGFAVCDDTPQARMVRLHEVYCTYMALLHDKWMHSSQNLMEFNNLLNETDIAVVHRLCQKDTIVAFQMGVATD